MHNYIINDRLLSVHLHVRTFSHLAMKSDDDVCLSACVCVFVRTSECAYEFVSNT